MTQHARCNELKGCVLQGDIMSADFPPSSFDGVAAFPSVFHLPKEEQEDFSQRVRGWLKPDGHFLATLSNASFAINQEPVDAIRPISIDTASRPQS